MSQGSDVEPTVKLTDADLARVWDKPLPEGLLLGEDEGATEMLQMLSQGDLALLEPDAEVYSLEGPSVATDPVQAARQRMPHASHTPAPAPRRVSRSIGHPILMRAMLASDVAGTLCVAVLWWLRL